MRWCKGLLDGTRADPAEQVQWAACLVVGSTATSATKGLLSNHSARWFVVDVKVSSAVAKRSDGRLDVASVGGEDGAGKRILRG